MNIFSVLSQGKSSLNEVGMSAMLGYLLNPNQDHGIGKTFLNSFLSLANNNFYQKYIDGNYKFEIDLEVQYFLENKRKDIDIQIKILDNNYAEQHRIIIENKIKASSFNTNQLRDYYDAVVGSGDSDDPFELSKDNLSVIFLTPDSKNTGLISEFENLQIDNKFWLYWNSDNQEIITVVNLIQNILELEHKGKIPPINEYLKHTIKAFNYYIIKTIDISSGKNRVGEDIGEVKQQAQISINNEEYTIIQRDSSQIQLFNNSGEKVVARPLLIEFLKENNLLGKYKGNNTRSFGRHIFHYLNNK